MEAAEPDDPFVSFRKNLFQRLYPGVDISRMDQIVFEQESSQISNANKLFYFNYFSELRNIENQIKEDELKNQEYELKNQEYELKNKEIARRNQKENEVKQLLSSLYSTETIEMLLKYLPANIFFDEVQNIERAAVLTALQIVFPAFNVSQLESHCNAIYFKLFAIKSDEEMNSAGVCIPEFPSNPESRTINVKDTRSEFFPHGFIYKRECFHKMYEEIQSVVKHYPIAVIGDPGIGKTTFMRYMFLRIIHEFPNAKIYWEMESGQWIFYKFGQFQTGVHDILDWSNNDVIVLIDGKLKPKFLKKQKNIILFCSPQPKNYTKLIKTYSGATFVMPPWDVDELINFLWSDDKISIIMGKFYDRMMNSVNDAAGDEDYDERTSIINSNQTDFDINQIGSVDEYKERERIKILSKSAFLIEQVMYRYKLCGGKIRLLLHNQINFKLLKEQVIKSVRSLSLDDLKHQECLDLQRNVPSIIYSMSPVNFDSDPREFQVDFASNYISEIASARMIYEYSKKLNILFAAMQNQRVGSSLIGQIFEKLVIESIFNKKLTELNGKSLEVVNAESGITLSFGDFVPQDYDANDKNLKRLISEESCFTNHLFTPIQSNAAAVDAVYYMHSTRKLYFLQMTISMFHDFKFNHLRKLATSFGKQATDIELLFLVPENCYEGFRKQNALTMKNEIMKSVQPGFAQSVLVVPQRVYNSIN